MQPYLIIVIFFTLTQFLENKIYTQKRQFFALNLYKFTPAKKNLHGYTCGSRDKYEVWMHCDFVVIFTKTSSFNKNLMNHQ